MNTDQLNSVKSQLARILAVENIHIMHSPGATTASFDVKNRILSLPVWQNISNDLYDMLIVHEVGHALDTPTNGWIDGIKEIVNRVHGKSIATAERAVKDFLNVVEDARIDKRQKRRYPGSKRNYVVGYKELLDRDFFGLKNRDIDALGFIDRANIYFKGGATLLNIKFSDEEKKFIKAMENLETFEEVMKLTEEIYSWSKAHHENEETQTVKAKIVGFDEDEDEDYEDDEFLEMESSDLEDAEDDEDISSLKSKGNADDEEEDEEGDSSDEDEDEDENTAGSSRQNEVGGMPEEDYVPQSETEEAVRKNLSSIVMDNDVNYIHVTVPEFYHDKIVEDFSVVVPRMEKDVKIGHPRSYRAYDMTPEKSKADFLEWKNREKDTISFMIKEFEMRKSASAYSRISVAKTGKLDMNKLHSFQYNDDIFRKLAVIPKGKNHGFVMFLDWSGSMDVQLKNTVKQLLSLSMFCKKVQIPFDVYFFRTAMDQDFNDGLFVGPYSVKCPASRRQSQMSSKQGDLMFGTFKLCNVLSSRMDHAMFNRAMLSLWMAADFATRDDQLMSTPLNQAILAADKIVNDFRIKNKIEIVSTIFLSDGASDPVDGIVDDKAIYAKLPSKPKGNKYVLVDPISKRTYMIDSLHYGYTGVTNIFLSILKERTNSNLIGFYLFNDNRLHNCSQVPYELSMKNENKEFWRTNGFFPVKNAGYDEYYIINGSILGQAYQNNLNVTSSMKKSTVAKEFIKFAGRKQTNRVLLSNFIKQIAADKKAA